MSPADFQRIVDQVAGRTMAVSLYYLGDPLTHPDLDEICTIAWKAGLNSHVSSNFSFVLADGRIRTLVSSGLTHLTVCVDGLTQETYGRTRVGGRIDLVLDNLERLLRCRRELGRTYPRVEVQFIKFQHNLHELGAAAERCRALGVDQFTEMWGGLHNYADVAPGTYRVGAPKPERSLPHCVWPHFSMQIKYNGDVIPCCTHRLATQYHPTAETRALGNVLAAPLREVWNSPAYRAVRRFVSNPERVRDEPGLADTFCDGCDTIFDTGMKEGRRMADQHRWEDLYQIDSRRRVTKRNAAGPAAAAAGVPDAPRTAPALEA
jgi:MoaA/NifB/PqqE/SkfB family radical SAM enzyme